MTLAASKVTLVVTVIRLGMVFTAFMEASPAMVGLVVRAGVLAQIVVTFKAVRAEIIAVQKTFQGSQGAAVLIFQEEPKRNIAVTVGKQA